MEDQAQERIFADRYQERVIIEPIRLAVEDFLRKENITLTRLAERLGFICKKGRWEYGDFRRLQRILGMSKERQTHMNYKTAVMIVREIGRDPWEFDI